VQHIAN